MAKKENDFGRNEMAALLGGGALLENLTKKTEAFAGMKQQQSIQGRDKEDVSNLTVAQTAALLKEKDLEKQTRQSRSAPSRLRAQKRNHVPQHHALLIEEQQRLDQERISIENKEGHRSNDESESEDDLQEEGDFVSAAHDRKGRKKVEPQIMVRRAKAEPQVISSRRRRRPQRDSSSDEYSSDESSHARKEECSSSSEDDRRERVLAKRRQRLENQKKIQKANEVENKSEDRKDSTNEKLELSSKQKGKTRNQRPIRDSSSDSNTSKESNASLGNSSDGSDSSSSSEDSSSDDDSCAPVIAKPLFVPRNKRQTVLSAQQKQESEKAAKLQEQDENRKMQSRLMIAQAVAAHSSNRKENFNGEDEGGGATNAMPDDTDPSDPIELEKLRDEWEVREIQRLLESQDLRESKAEELAEYERCRNMTDQERLSEDRALGLYQKPGEQRRQKNEDGEKSGHYLQRYYHRGAFFMDEEEWDEKDVRHKAKEYEKAVTGDDKIDKRNLPKIMQVKNFGFARQNTRYKGLSHEDTTDKGVEYLPLKHNNKKRR